MEALGKKEDRLWDDSSATYWLGGFSQDINK